MYLFRRDGVVHPAPTRTVASVLVAGASRERILPTLPLQRELYVLIKTDIIGKSGIVDFQAII